MKRRNTPAKEKILDALKNADAALSHDMIQSQLDTHMDRATIYRILNRFCEDGSVHKIIGDDGKQYFAFCINCKDKNTEHTHNHFHFRCMACGTVKCLKNEIEIHLPKGYISKRFNGVISGQCPSCS